MACLIISLSGAFSLPVLLLLCAIDFSTSGLKYTQVTSLWEIQLSNLFLVFLVMLVASIQILPHSVFSSESLIYSLNVFITSFS